MSCDSGLRVREADGTLVGDFSTDADGHCFFYAAASQPAGDESTWRRGGGASNGGDGGVDGTQQARYRGTSSIANTPLRYTQRYGLNGKPDRWDDGAHSPGATRAAGSAFFSSATEPVAGGERALSISGGGFADGAGALSDAVNGGSQEHSGGDGDDGAAAGPALYRVKELRRYDPRGIHNELQPGEGYQLSLADPSRLLVFYTHCLDNEMAEVESAEDEVVPFEMPRGGAPAAQPAMGKLRQTGGPAAAATASSAAAAARLPVQLYCRARPWFQILVYDMHSLEELGGSYGFPFSITRLPRKHAENGKEDGAQHQLRSARREQLRSALRSARSARELRTLALSSSSSFGASGGLWEYLALTMASHGGDSLAAYWARAEVAAVARGGGSAATGPDVEEEALLDELEAMDGCEVVASGRLSHDMERRFWMVPGERYAVEVACEEPCLKVGFQHMWVWAGGERKASATQWRWRVRSRASR
eukprot:352650-Chlamydomonas_euryale.AAC.3